MLQAPAWGVLDGLEDKVREKALAWQRHIREVETGFPEPGGAGVPREGFDPMVRSLAEREAAKAGELAAQGQPVSVATVRRVRARFHSQGLWSLVDGRARRPRSAGGHADERVVTTIRKAFQAQRDRSTGTLSRLRRSVGRDSDRVHHRRSLCRAHDCRNGDDTRRPNEVQYPGRPLDAPRALDAHLRSAAAVAQLGLDGSGRRAPRSCRVSQMRMIVPSARY